MNTLPPEYLDGIELHLLTGYTRGVSQVSWLKNKDIPYRQDGRRVIVSRIHVRAWLEGRSVVHSTGLNLVGINEKSKYPRLGTKGYKGAGGLNLAGIK